MSLDIQVQERTAIRRLDLNLIFVILALNLIGLINLFSATHGGPGDMTRLFYQQIVWLLVGWSIFLIVTFIDYRFFIRISPLIFGLNIIALFLVEIFGKYYYGAQRWLDIGFFHYQPSETMKLALILILANVLSRRSVDNGLGLKELIAPIAIMGIPFILTAKQPDLGTAMMLAMITTALLFFIKLRTYVIVTAVLCVMTIIPVAWNFLLKDYQKNRVLTFLDPGRDPRGTGYNSIQSRIAVGSGKWLGKGFRKGTQAQLEFLPERHTDFIFSVLSEEHGFVGSVTTVGLFAVLLIIGVRIASQARDKMGALLTVGVLSMIFIHMFINIGMVTGLLPIVGIPLPLISYGGSSLLTNMLALGLVSSVSMRRFLF